jgi:hypothetical protein
MRTSLVNASTPPPAAVASCRLCRADVIHCHEVSVEHADGSTACADPWCNLPHHLHEWHLACDAFDPPCPCAGADRPYVDTVPLLRQAA